MARESDDSRGPADPARRRLLKAAPLAGAAAAVTAAGPAAAESHGDPHDPRDTVYSETEHVRAYYTRARG